MLADGPFLKKKKSLMLSVPKIIATRPAIIAIKKSPSPAQKARKNP